MTIIGLPEHLKNYALSYSEYFATGEGITINAEIVNNISNYSEPAVAYPGRELIPCVIEKHLKDDIFDQKYLDWNPEFKSTFYECFGVKMWNAFVKCCIEHKNVLDLKVEMHYNLS